MRDRQNRIKERRQKLELAVAHRREHLTNLNPKHQVLGIFQCLVDTLQVCGALRNVLILYQHASELPVLSNLNNESMRMNIDGKRRLTQPRQLVIQLTAVQAILETSFRGLINQKCSSHEALGSELSMPKHFELMQEYKMD